MSLKLTLIFKLGIALNYLLTHRIYAVINLNAKVIRGFSFSAQGDFSVALDSNENKFGGSEALPASYRASKSKINLPQLAPYQVIVFERR